MDYIYEKNGRKREAAMIECNHCKCWFLKQIRFTKVENFCSLKCSSLSRTTRIETKCATCKSPLTRKPSDLLKSKSKLYFCNRLCKEEAQKIGGIEEIHPSHYGKTLTKYRLVCFRNNGLKKVCNRCGFDNELAICVHHIDRNRSNNKIENLEVLCANCHAIEHNKEK